MYTNKSALQNYLLTTISDSFDTQIEAWINAADAYIDNYCNTSFESSTETRYFDGNGSNELILDDLLTVTSLQFLDPNGVDLDDTLTENDDFFLYPYNETCKYKIILNPEGDQAEFPKGSHRIKITGTWGKSTTVPADIKLVSTKLVAGIIEVGKSGEVTLKKEKIGDYSVEYGALTESNQDIKDILNRYRVSNLGRK
jgi:hypothetical protein